jgi:hypothetical protein
VWIDPKYPNIVNAGDDGGLWRSDGRITERRNCTLTGSLRFTRVPMKSERSISARSSCSVRAITANWREPELARAKEAMKFQILEERK